MIDKVEFEKKWTEEFLQDWMKNPEDERYDELTIYDRDELLALSMLREEYPDVSIEMLHKLAEKAVWRALDIHMSNIMESEMSLREVACDLAEILSEEEEPALR